MEYPTLIDFSVTQTDIDEGEARDCTRCPVAQAVARSCDRLNLASQASPALWDHVNKFCPVDVVPLAAYVFGAVYRTDPETDEFIDAFDAGKPVEPFTGQLRLLRIVCEG